MYDKYSIRQVNPLRSDHLVIAGFDPFTIAILTSFEQQNSLASLPQTVGKIAPDNVQVHIFEWVLFWKNNQSPFIQEVSVFDYRHYNRFLFGKDYFKKLFKQTTYSSFFPLF